MKLRIFLMLLAMFSDFPALNARISPAWTFQEMFDKADFVVIAEVVSTKETEERNTLQDIEPHVAVIGILTDFKSRLVLKGSHSLATFQLHHYRFRSEDDKFAANGPDLVDLSGYHQIFLLFLVKEKDGKYAPVTGQTDPASLSVLELKASVVDAPGK